MSKLYKTSLHPPTRHRMYDDETREMKRIRRAQQGHRPLEKMIRNAAARCKTVWNRGHYGNVNIDGVPKRAGKQPSLMSPCAYYSADGQVENGYEIRLVLTRWCPLVAVWGFEGVVCVPMQFVEEGHRQGALDPGRPPMCNQCDRTTYSHIHCSFCGAPMFYPPSSW